MTSQITWIWTLDLTLDSTVNSASAQMEILDPQAADLPESKKRFPSWAGAEKSAADLNFGEKTAFLLRLVRTLPGRSDQP